MSWVIIALIWVASMIVCFLAGVGAAEGRHQLKQIHKRAEMQAALRSKKTDIVDKTYCFGKENGYELFKVNQN